MSAADRKDFQTLFILYTPNTYIRVCVLEHKMFYIKRRGGKEVPTTFSSNKVTQLECHVKYQRPLNSNQIIISDAAFNPPLSFVNISNSAITVCVSAREAMKFIFRGHIKTQSHAFFVLASQNSHFSRSLSFSAKQ
jgi:hypothetical protein